MVRVCWDVCRAAVVLFLNVPKMVAVLPAQEPTPGYQHHIPEELMTPETVDTRIGTLRFFDGLPDSATAKLAYDYLDFQRGVEVFLDFIPAASIEAIRRGLAGEGVAHSNQCLLFDKLMDSSPLFLTGNTDTVYAMVMLDLERDGATVIEIPSGSGPGMVNDAYFRFVVDMGSAGPDGGAGGKYLILPPDYEGDLDIPEEGAVEAQVDGQSYFVARSGSYVNVLFLRGFLVDGKPDSAAQMFTDGLKVYPLSAAGAPPAMEFVSGSGKSFNTIHANDFTFYIEIWQVLQKEPVTLFEPEILGRAAAIGLEKGKAFMPDVRMNKTLHEAVGVGNAIARTLSFAPRASKSYLYNNSAWYTPFVGGDYQWRNDGGNGGRNLDARTSFFYIATGNTPAMVRQMVGKGSQYAAAARDKNMQYLNGTLTYKLNIPKDVPAKDFWSVVVYDPQTRSQLQTSQGFPGKNNKRGALKTNEDGSVDVYFGPEAAPGWETNWIQTVPGKGWFVLLRMYGPLQGWFDKTWIPGEIEQTQRRS